TFDRMMALALHLDGRQAEACVHASRVLERPVTVNEASRHSGYQFHQRVAGLATLGRILWVRGYPESALRRASESVEEGLAAGHVLSTCFALSNAIPVAAWCGRWDIVERHARMLVDLTDEYSLACWRAFAAGFELVVARRGLPSGSEAPG